MLRFALALCLTVAASAVSAIEIKEVTSAGGINAWVVEEPSIPFTALEIRMRGGASLDLPGKRGATNLMMALIEEGSGDMDAQAFQTKLTKTRLTGCARRFCQALPATQKAPTALRAAISIRPLLATTLTAHRLMARSKASTV